MSKETIANEIRYSKYPRRNNDIAAAVYAMYQTGKSLEQIGKVYKKSRQTIYDVLNTRGYELRSKKLSGLQVYDGINFTLNPDGYLSGTVKSKRVLMNRYVWEKYNGLIPPGHVIHHINRIRTDNRIENLDLYKRSEHARKFSGRFKDMSISNFTK